MNLILFCTAFIVQFVGHRIGDYLFQTDYQAQNKAKEGLVGQNARFTHCSIYSITIAFMTSAMFSFDNSIYLWVLILTFVEHMIIDTRKPIIWWKTFLETKIAKQKDFDISSLPFFVMIEIDQTVHYIRIFLISILIGYGIL